jgi:hypothetical protein
MFYKRFLVFRGNQYYPAGGFADFTGSFDTLDEAIESFPQKYDWGEIVDLETGERRYMPNDWS